MDHAPHSCSVRVSANLCETYVAPRRSSAAGCRTNRLPLRYRLFAGQFSARLFLIDLKAS